ncbi:right-handed parallel beta-helix repeat-containing protein [Metabacillus halosaccharovorans]|uniref:right-handed parallel beta-helix repeat-containing protein n=1 Tax=Metabacillus halosaccharovorans TaxID=930124 RepID=UPI0034CFB641
MAFSKQTEFTKKVTDLPDSPSPSYTPTELKVYFQNSADELKTTFNKLVDDLNNQTGAEYAGARGFDGNKSTIQKLLDSLKTLVDNRTILTGDHKGTWQGLTPEKAGAADINAARITKAENDIGDVSSLKTDNKSSLQAAIDETFFLALSNMENIEERAEKLVSNLVVKIPSNYPTLQEAINELSTRVSKQGATIYVHIESGHQLTDGLDLRDGDYSHFRITSDDEVVYTANSFPDTRDRRASFYFQNCHAPSLQCTIDLGFKGWDGWYLRGSRGEWWSENEKPTGILGAGEDGLVVDQASVMRFMGREYDEDGSKISGNSVGKRAVFRCTNNGRINLHVHGSKVQARTINAIKEIDFSDGGKLMTEPNFYNILIIHNSEASIEGVIARNAYGSGLAVRKGSSCDAGGIDVSGSDRGIMVDDSSICNAPQAIANNCNLEGFTARRSSSLNLEGSTATGCFSGVDVQGASNCNCNNAILTGNNRGIVASSGSTISAENANCSNSSDRGLFAFYGSVINATGVNASGCVNHGVRVSYGSQVNIVNGNARIGSVDATNDISISEGSTVVATNAIGGFNQTVNTISNKGIIYK